MPSARLQILPGHAGFREFLPYNDSRLEIYCAAGDLGCVVDFLMNRLINLLLSPPRLIAISCGCRDVIRDRSCSPPLPLSDLLTLSGYGGDDLGAQAIRYPLCGSNALATEWSRRVHMIRQRLGSGPALTRPHALSPQINPSHPPRCCVSPGSSAEQLDKHLVSLKHRSGMKRTVLQSFSRFPVLAE